MVQQRHVRSICWSQDIMEAQDDEMFITATVAVAILEVRMRLLTKSHLIL